MDRNLIASILDQMSDEMQMAVQIRAAERGYTDPVDYIIDLRKELEGDPDFEKLRAEQEKKPQAEQEADFLREYFRE